MQEDLDTTVGLKQDSLATIVKLPERYELKGLIGQGGMGYVFKAFDHELGRDVAIKILMFDGSKSQDEQTRFLQEAKFLATLQHPNIVQILSSGIAEDGAPYHVMELLVGEPLSDEVERHGPLKPERFYEIFKQVTAGLVHAHSCNIVHRDLKPTNIMLCKTPDGLLQVKIIDFGIARVVDTSGAGDTTTLGITRTNAVLGSPVYMSPEQCRGSKVDHLSDIYSLACIMFECLTGKTVFQADSSFQIMYSHMNEEAPSLEITAQAAAGKRLGGLIDRCLRKNPAERPQSVAEIQKEMDEIYADVANDGISFNIRKRSVASSHSKTITVVAVVTLIVSAVAAVVVSNINRENMNRKSAIEKNWNQQQGARLKKEKLDQETELAYIKKRNAEDRMALSTLKDPDAIVDMVETMMERELHLVQVATQLNRYKEADDSVTETIEMCDRLEGAEVSRWKGGLYLSRASCRIRLKEFKKAEDDLAIADKLDGKHRFRWYQLRLQMLLNLARGRWDLVGPDLEEFPKCLGMSSHKMWLSKLFGTPMTLSDGLWNIFEEVDATESKSEKDKILKAKILITLARDFLNIGESGRAERAKADKCLSRANAVVDLVNSSEAASLRHEIEALHKQTVPRKKN